MTESFPPAAFPESKGESADKFQAGLVADYLCAKNPKDEETALAALRKDELRLAMAGMTPGQRELWNTLDKVDWKAVQREGLTAVMPALFGAYIGLTAGPEDATRIAAALGGAGFGLELLSMAAVVPEAIAKHQRASGLAKAIAAVRVGTFYAGKVGLWIALGTGAAALAHRGWEARAAAQTAGGVGEARGGGAIGGLPPDERVSGSAVHPQSPDVNLPPPSAETVVPYLPQAPIDAGETQLQAAEAEAAAQDAARQALLSGKTIGELAQSSGQLPWNAVRESVGNAPHGGEISNALTRALQVGGVDISSLHEGAISQLTAKMQELFGNADKALETFNLGHPYAPRPYDAGGLGAVETVKGLNSIEAQAIRAANLGDMEAAGNLYNNVLRGVLNP